MGKIRDFRTGWKEDRDYRVFARTMVSMAINLAYAAYTGFLGVHYSSLWYGTICVYYIILTVLRFGIVLGARLAKGKENRIRTQDKEACAASVLLLLLNISLVVPISLIVRQKTAVEMTLTPSIALAAYTTYKVTIASIRFKRGLHSVNSLAFLVQVIGFIDVLASILTLENTLIIANAARNKNNPDQMVPVLIITGTIIFLAILGISIATLWRSIRKLRKPEVEEEPNSEDETDLLDGM